MLVKIRLCLNLKFINWNSPSKYSFSTTTFLFFERIKGLPDDQMARAQTALWKFKILKSSFFIVYEMLNEQTDGVELIGLLPTDHRGGILLRLDDFRRAPQQQKPRIPTQQ